MPIIQHNLKQILLFAVAFSFALATESSALCVKADEANLRAGPGAGYKKTWSVYKYMPLLKLRKKGSWYKVKDLDGDVHWIYSSLVSKNKMFCGAIKSEAANLRTGPGTRYPRFSSYPKTKKYYSFKVLEFKGKWIKVRDETGDTFWVAKKLAWVQK